MRKGLGLLFRAAKTAVDSLPTGKLEDVVMSGAREVGRAVENVADTIDRELFHKGAAAAPVQPPPPEANNEHAAPAKASAPRDEAKASAEPAKKGDEAAKGPRVG